MGLQVATHAACPVIVVRTENWADRWTTGPIVVGVDVSPASPAAVGFAFEEAAFRGVELVALHVYRPPASFGPGGSPPPIVDEGAMDIQERAVLTEDLAE